MPLELYRGRPGFQDPYEGPTRPTEELPEEGEASPLPQRPAHRVAPAPAADIPGGD